VASKTLKASVLIGGSITPSLRAAIGNTKDGLTRIGQAIADVDKRQRLLGQSIQTFGKMGKNVDGLRREYDQLTLASDRLRASQSRLAAAQRAVDANMARRSALGGQMMGAVGTAVATGFAIGKPVMNAANFARENRLIGNTANMSREEVAALGATILREARITNQGANELQKAIGFLVAAGLDVKTAEASIRTIGRTTTAAGADIEDLSKASFTLIDALKIDTDKGGLQAALDILAVAGKEGNVELKDMAKVLPSLGAGFVALKMGGTEAVATIGAALEIARKGTDSADKAATNMDNFLSKIMSPETRKKAQKNFGLDIAGVIERAQKSGANPFEAAMQAVIKATGGDQKKIGDLFQDMEVQKFIRPMIQNWDEYVRIKNKALTKSAGTTDKDFALMMEQQAEQMKAAKIAADNLAKTFGAQLLPTIGNAAGKMAVFMDKATAFVNEHPHMVVGATKIAAAFVGLRVAGLAAGYAFTFVAGPFLKVAALLARFRAAGAVASLGQFGATALRVGGAVRWIATAFAAIGGGPVTIAIGALVAGAILVRKYWEPIKAFFSGMWEGFSSAMQPAMDGLFTALAPLKPAWDAVAAAVGKTWEWFGKLLEPVHLTGEQLKSVTDAGKTFGVVLGAVISNGLRGFAALVRVIGWVIDKAATMGNIVARVPIIGGPAAMGRDALSGEPNQGAPELPKPAARGAAAYTDQSTHTYNITQQPGESQEALARRIAEEQKRQAQVNNRGRLTD
jgi:TP901 family phage tail tape measure protein